MPTDWQIDFTPSPPNPSVWGRTVNASIAPLDLPPVPSVRARRTSKQQELETWIVSLGQPFASGKFGTLYTLKYDDSVRDQIKSLFARDKHAIIHIPGHLSRLAIKVQYANTKVPFKYQAALWENESQAHKDLRRLSCVPNLYAAGRIGTMHLTVMKFIRGVPLRLTQPTVNAYQGIEDCLVKMWLEGWSHSDAHDKNVLLTKDGGSVKAFVVDFGSAVKLPDDVRQAVRQAVSEGREAIDIYDSIIQPYVDAYKRTWGFTWYNPNAKALRVYRTHTKKLAAKELEKRLNSNSTEYYSAES